MCPRLTDDALVVHANIAFYIYTSVEVLHPLRIGGGVWGIQLAIQTIDREEFV